MAFPGTMDHARQMALALHECRMLDAYVTGFVYCPGGWIDEALKLFPETATKRARLQLSRRAVTEVPRDRIDLTPFWDIARIAANGVGAGPRLLDWLWERRSIAFDRKVARRWVPRAEAVFGFEFTALESFRAAERHGVARILDLPSLDSRAYEEILRRERDLHPALCDVSDGYFDSRFEERYAHRQQEIALADVILANSSLTARSHVKAGADPAKVFSVPLGGIRPLSEIRRPPFDAERPLRAVWAGAFSIRKGAHYLLEAWAKIARGRNAVLDVYGSNILPADMVRRAGDSVVFHGRIPQQLLFEKFEAADILVFPTLSDGFGAVITEALAHGLPVITTDQAGAADLLDANSSLVVPAADAAALADALAWCLDNRRVLEDMREKALAVAAGRQWNDYRRGLIAAVDTGLRQQGYAPRYREKPAAGAAEP